MTRQKSTYFPDVEIITAKLVNHFGRPTLGNKRNPFNELLYIILSSKTPPDRYQEVYQTFRSRYPVADELAQANWMEVAQEISRAGLQNRKAKAIVTIAQRLKRKFGRVTLSPLKQMTDEEVEQFLVSLPEVSLKSARCIMMYALDRQVFPVDTHCFRISNRLGWIKGNANFSKSQANAIQEGIPLHLRHDLHVGMVLLGRNHCTPHHPKCNECPILQHCSTGKRFQQVTKLTHHGRTPSSPHTTPQKTAQ